MIYDVCVLGGGPAGIFSAYYSASRGLKTILLEADDKLGGRIHYFLNYPLYDIPGLFGIRAQDYLDGLILQLQKSDASVLYNTVVTKVEKHKQYFSIESSTAKVSAKAIILATGNGIIVPKKITSTMLPCEINEKIRYDIPQFHVQKPRRIAIIGHTPTAIEWAIQAKTYGHDVTIYAYKSLTLQPILMDELKRLSIQVMAYKNTKAWLPVKDGIEIDKMYYDEVYAHIGTKKLTIALPETLHQHDNSKTSINGIFVAGDARNEYGKQKLIIGAIHDAMQAVNEANLYLHPDHTYQPIVSTHHPIFKEWDH